MTKILLTVLLFFSLKSAAQKAIWDSPAMQQTWTSIMKFSYKGDTLSILKLLKDGAEINSYDSTNRWNALRVAIFKGNLKMVKFLVRHGINLEWTDNISNTPLMDACFNNNLAMVEYLSDNHANISYVSANGFTPLIEAVNYSKGLTMLELLVKRGNVNINSVTDNGYNALRFAVYNGDCEKIIFLLNHGAKMPE